MIRALPVALLLLAAACQKQPDEASTTNETANQAAEVTAPAKIPALEGSWKVVTVDGNPAVGRLEMAASFSDGSATLATGCLKRAWTYTQDRNSVTFNSSPSGSANCGSSPSAEEEAAYAALERANIAVFAKEGNSTTLSGTGGVLTLERR